MNHSLRGVDVETLTSEWRKAQRYNMSTGSETYSMSDFWKMFPKGSRFATTNAWGETSP